MQKGQVKKYRNYKITLYNILEYVWKFVRCYIRVY